MLTDAIIEQVHSLATAAGSALRYSSDAGAEAAAQALLELVEEGEAADLSKDGLNRKVSAAISRAQRADTRSLRLVAAQAERSDRTPVIPWETQTHDGRRKTAAGLTAGNVERMTDAQVDAILAAHSGVSGITTRKVSATTIRTAERTTTLPDDLAAVLAPRPVTDEQGTTKRTQGAQWARVSTARGEYMEVTDPTDRTPWHIDPTATLDPDRYGLDDGTVRGIRHRESDAGNGSYTLAIVHSAEQQTLRGATTDALELAACLPWQPVSRTRPNASAVTVWLRLAEQVSATHAASLTDYLDRFTVDPSSDRAGKRIGKLTVAWGRLSADLNTDADTTRRTLTAWAEHTRKQAHRIEQPQPRNLDNHDPLPYYVSPPRQTFASSFTEDPTRTAWLAQEEARRILSTTNHGIHTQPLHAPESARQRIYAALAHAWDEVPVTPPHNAPSNSRGGWLADATLSPSARVARPGAARTWTSTNTNESARRAHARADTLTHSGPAPASSEPLARLTRDSRQR